MQLTDLFEKAGIVADRILGDAPLTDIVSDSRKVSEGALFVCMPSKNSDSHQYLKQAKEAGAVAALTHTEAGCEAAWSLDLAAVLIKNQGDGFIESLWKICKVFFGNPSGSMRVIGLTGTNGKTTTTWILRDALEALGRKAAYMGTLGYKTPNGMVTLENTTPFAVDLNRILYDAKKAGIQDFTMEVSSHALAESRVDGIEFNAAVFTNLTQDHLDYHKTMEAYAEAKKRLYTDLPHQSDKHFVGAVNIDDPTGAVWAKELSCPLVTYGTHGGDLKGTPIEVTVNHTRLSLTYKGQTLECKTNLGGTFNVQNMLSACAGLLALGYSLEEAVKGLASATAVPGRFEAIPNSRGVGVLVDYAHTPDALVKLLDAAKALKPRRLIAVFGCGGDRDRTKRPIMARTVSERADITIVTSDNPRTEDPLAIIQEVQNGLLYGCNSVSIPDRKDAIQAAVNMAHEGDIVVIAGKGHEDYQIIGRTKYPMDDRKMAREALEVLG
jgi:UDP-N-acetylmuramoyl-L-alanyl-D-glutamate--2,6-diaminopimelate ligase